MASHSLQAALKIGHSEHSVKSANTTQAWSFASLLAGWCSYQGTRTTTSTPKAITPKEEAHVIVAAG